MHVVICDFTKGMNISTTWAGVDVQWFSHSIQSLHRMVQKQPVCEE